MKWSSVTRAKHDGGLGFRELESFNLALLGKMAYRLLKEPNALWARVLKGIYFPTSDFLHAGKGSRPSWAWSSIMEGRAVVKDGSVWSLGDGRIIRPFMDAWIPGRSNARLGLRPVQQRQAETVLYDWINHEEKEWNSELVRAELDQNEAEMVLGVQIPLVPRGDELKWPFERKGAITVRSAYHFIRSQAERLEEAGVGYR